MLRGTILERPARIDNGLPVLAVAGFLVGVGTRMGSGCTSVDPINQRRPTNRPTRSLYMRVDGYGR